MKILITGATGFVGTALIERLFMSGYSDIRVLTRSKNRALKSISFPIEAYEWDLEKKEIEEGCLKDVDVVIHLAGENVAGGRWTAERKQKILSSRRDSTALLLKEIKRSGDKPKKFLSASANGIYGDRGSELLTENSTKGEGFLSDVCEVWEESLRNCGIDSMKLHFLRTGIVLGIEDGALAKMLTPFKMGVGGKLGSGDQYMSWIHLDDLVGQFIYLMENDEQAQIFNAVAPQPVTNKEFTKELGSCLGVPAVLPAPKFGLKLALGEMSDILFASQNVVPENFIASGFEFKFPVFKDALEDCLQYTKRGEVVFKNFQWLKSERVKVFDFFADEKNLEKITPPFLNFKVLGMDTDQIQSGSHIRYKLQVHGVPLEWHSRIEDYQQGKRFIDWQMKGPYKKWHHTHEFLDCKDGTLIVDRVVYSLPMGILGRVFAGAFVAKDVRQIFAYRNTAISKFFS